jgi:hypothetical protein
VIGSLRTDWGRLTKFPVFVKPLYFETIDGLLTLENAILGSDSL